MSNTFSSVFIDITLSFLFIFDKILQPDIVGFLFWNLQK